MVPEQEDGARLQLISPPLDGTILPAIPQNSTCSGAVLCQTCLRGFRLTRSRSP